MVALMRSTRPRLNEPAGFDSPTRAALALAIAARDAFLSTTPDRFTADGVLTDRVNACRADLRAADQALEEAKKADAGSALAAALGEAGHPASGTAKARVAVQTATDTLEVAEAALAALPARMDTAETERERLLKRVDRAAARVLGEHPFVAALAGRVDAMQREVIALTKTLDWLRGAGAIPVTTYETTGPNISPGDLLINRAVGRLNMQGRFWFQGTDNVETSTRFGAAPWAQALDDLKANAQALLPIVELP